MRSASTIKQMLANVTKCTMLMLLLFTCGSMQTEIIPLVIHRSPLIHPIKTTNYFGVVKIDILPPPGLFHPALPHREGGKLTFPLCSACDKSEIKKPLLEKRRICDHPEDQRVLRGTWCTPEIEKALSLGYKLIKIHEVWHFPSKQEELFRPYVQKWLKIKQESSGYPSWAVTDEQKQQYIADYKAKEGISLDPQQTRKNPGKKATAKLMLNSFWGKFGENLDKPHSHNCSRSISTSSRHTVSGRTHPNLQPESS